MTARFPTLLDVASGVPDVGAGDVARAARTMRGQRLAHCGQRRRQAARSKTRSESPARRNVAPPDDVAMGDP